MGVEMEQQLGTWVDNYSNWVIDSWRFIYDFLYFLYIQSFLHKKMRKKLSQQPHTTTLVIQHISTLETLKHDHKMWNISQPALQGEVPCDIVLTNKV